ncbi:MAG: hypothetical protein HXY27_05935 [Hydrogenophilaceae bacterium]|nr:hypothetical protein [Hydrogenophilaceae bacterium]
MEEPNKHGTRFWAGNAVLVIALLVMLFMGTLSQFLGMGAMFLWMALAALGFYLIYTDK